uniref:Uncharacterized protein n=1 Tax=Rhizophora mucronata TaxID=61149 RepID=A0A2P2NGF9_RHIMU
MKGNSRPDYLPPHKQPNISVFYTLNEIYSLLPE